MLNSCTSVEHLRMGTARMKYVFYKEWKKYNEIQLTKNKMDLDNRKKNHPPSPTYHSLPKPHNVTAFHPSPGENPPERRRSVPKNTETKQKWPREYTSSTYDQGSPLLPIFRSLIITLPPQSSLCCPRRPSYYPSNLTS